MNKFFSNNLPWKLASLFFAAMLWIFVINTQNPILPKDIKGKSINIRGINELEDKGYVLQNEAELRALQPKITVRGQRLEMEKLINEGKGLDIRLDLSEAVGALTTDDSDSIEKQIKITVVHNLEGIKVEGIKPDTVSVIFEKEKKIIKDIETNIIGETNNEYMMLEPVLSPGNVEISGPKSFIDQVDSAIVDINIDDFSEDILSYTVPVRLVNKDGEDVKGVKLFPEHIEVTLPIGKKKKIEIKEQFKGNLPSGYIRTNVLVMPNEVTVVGDPSVVDKLNEVQLEPISLDNMIQSTTFNANLILPDNVTLIDKIGGKAVVTIEIQKESLYEYELNTKDLIVDIVGLPEDEVIHIVDKALTIKLSGTAENILAITGKNLNATIDFTTVNLTKVNNSSEGICNVPVKFDIPNNLKIIDAPNTLEVKIEEKEPVFNEDNDSEVDVEADVKNEDELLDTNEE
ncbi:MAG: CdaR family protein [Cellulosilyticaceae bacterium]